MVRLAAMLRAPEPAEVVDESAGLARLAALDLEIAELQAELDAIEAELAALAEETDEGLDPLDPDGIDLDGVAAGSLGNVEAFVANLVASAESELAADRAWAERAAAERIAHAAATANDYLAIARARAGSALIELSQASDPELVALAESAAEHLAHAAASGVAGLSFMPEDADEVPAPTGFASEEADGLGLLDADAEAAFEAFVRRSEEAKAQSQEPEPRAPGFMRRRVIEVLSSAAGLVVAVALTMMVVG